MLCLHVLGICACVVYFFILVTRRECPHSSLCCVCFVKHHLLLSFPKVLSKSCVVCPVAFFSCFPPILLYSSSPLWGLRLSAVRGVMHTDETHPHLLLSLLGGARGEIMTEKELKSTSKNSCPTDFVSFLRPPSASPFIPVGKRASPAEGRYRRVWEQIRGNGREC